MSDEQNRTGEDTGTSQEIIVKLAPESLEAIERMLQAVVLRPIRVNLLNNGELDTGGAPKRPTPAQER